MSVRASNTRPSTGLTRRPSLIAHRRNSGVCAATGPARATSKHKYCGDITLPTGNDRRTSLATRAALERNRAKKGPRRSASLWSKRWSFGLEAEFQTEAELSFVDSFPREILDSGDCHEVRSIANSAVG